VVRQDVWSVGTTEYHELGRERSEALDLLDRPNGVVGIDGP